MKESFNGPEFLGEKFQDIHTSEGAKVLAKYTTRKENLSQKGHKNATIDRYLQGLDRVIKNRPVVARMIEESITDDYVLDTNNEELVESLARDLYESEKKIAINQGRGGDIQQLDDEEILNRYRQNITEKAKIQKESLQSWIRYLKEGEDYPMWFKYYVVRSLKKMGQFNRDTTSYSTRTENTIAPFPEMNAESLAFAFQALIGELEKEGLELNEERKEELEKELDKRLTSKDFSKLYAFAQVECAGNLDRESLEGEWVIYPQGSDYKGLEKGLKGKGTGWCTASGSAQGQLANGDFHVFYTKNKGGVPTEPRIAVRMENYNGRQVIAEVRGIDPGQALEPALVDIAKKYYSKLDGAERYEKADRDMKMLTAIYEKCFKVGKDAEEKEYLDPTLPVEEIEFIFEIDQKIEGFGYKNDPRIKEILSHRGDFRHELTRALDCRSDQIALDLEDLKADDILYTRVDIHGNNWNLDKRPTLPIYANDVQLDIGSRDGITLPKIVKGYLSLSVDSLEGVVWPEYVGNLSLSIKDGLEVELPDKIYKSLDLRFYNQGRPRIILPEIFRDQVLTTHERNSAAICCVNPLNTDVEVLLFSKNFEFSNKSPVFIRNYFSNFPENKTLKFFEFGFNSQDTVSMVSSRISVINEKMYETLTVPECVIAYSYADNQNSDSELSTSEVVGMNLEDLGLRPLDTEEVDILTQRHADAYEGSLFVVDVSEGDNFRLKYLRLTNGELVNSCPNTSDRSIVVGFSYVRYKGDPIVNKFEPMRVNPFEDGLK